MRRRTPLPKEYNWLHVAFFALSPPVAFISVCAYVYHSGLHPGDVASLGFMLCCTGLAVNAGYHHYYSHRSYECHRIVQLFHLLFGAAAIQKSALSWASRHRAHHRFVDREGDPYNIQKGFFWAHIGWALYKNPQTPEQQYANVPDLTADPLAVWQDRHFHFISLATCVVLPLLIGYTYGRPWGSFLWGGLLRIVLFQHITFLINSAGHSIGSQPYSTRNSSRDNWWLAFLMFGGGYHNFHHAFPGDYRSSFAWYHWDPAKWWIWSLNRVGLTHHLKRTPLPVIMRARQRMAHVNAERRSHTWSAERKSQCPPNQ